MKIDTSLTDLQLIDIDDLAAVTKRSKPSLWRDLEAGKLPRELRLSRSVRFRLRDVRRWLEVGCPSRDEFERLTSTETTGGDA